ncbi:MAG: prolyl-tRNA synthetase associated domain-containing protein [Minwuia sp.]|uniref:prolyl-tRNA synthetase associated domain-containing protein n=1 Tax=Minwuia sp. TaxID=2493630 RepID=UPI003A8B061D
MAATRDELMAFLDGLDVETETVEHPPVFTVEEAQAHRGDLDGGHTKNLFLKDKKGGLWLVVCLEDRRVDLKALRKRLGAPQFSFGKPDLLIEVLGIEPGSVTPFSLINDTEGRVTAVFDKGMLELSPLNFHPLKNDATTQITPQDLLKFARATGHEPVISEIDETDAA